MHTSAATRAGLAGQGARSQRCTDVLTYNSNAPAIAGATIKTLPMIQRDSVCGGGAALMRMIIIHASTLFGSAAGEQRDLSRRSYRVTAAIRQRFDG